MTKNENLKQSLTKVVSATMASSKGKKSKGTVVATIVRDVPVIPVEPFSI